MLQTLALKIGVALLAIAAVAGISWFAAKAHYQAEFVALKASIEQEARDAQKAVDDKRRADETVSKEVNDAAIAQIGTMSDTISRLLRERATIRLTAGPGPAVKGAGEAHGQPDGSGPAAGPAANPQPPATVAACLDPGTLGDVLDIADQAITEVLLFRQYARETGQAP